MSKIKQLIKFLPSSYKNASCSLSRSRVALRKCLKCAEDSNPEMFKTLFKTFYPAVVSCFSGFMFHLLFVSNTMII